MRAINFVPELACRDAHGQLVGLGAWAVETVDVKKIGLGLNGQFWNSIWTGWAGNIPTAFSF